MTAVQKHVQMLGLRVKDKVTGFAGTVSSVSFDLYGCVQAVVQPDVDNDGKPRDGMWCDVARLEVTDTRRSMPVPDFDKGYVADGKKGPAAKPAFARHV